MNDAEVRAAASKLLSRLEEGEDNSISEEMNALLPADRLAVAQAMQEYNEKHRAADPTLPKLEIFALDQRLIDIRLSQSEKITDVYDRLKMPSGTEVLNEKSPQGSFDQHDPYQQIEEAHQFLLEMKSLEKEPRNKPITVLAEQGATTTTVGERLKELRHRVKDAYEQSINTAEQLNAPRARDLVAAIDEIITKRTAENSALYKTDLFAHRKDDFNPTKEDERFITFSLPELLVLREKVLEKVSAQTVCHQLYATLLADEGNLDEAKKHAEAAAKFGRFDNNPVLLNDVEHLDHLIRRKELAGEDPLELLRLADRAKQCGDGLEAMTLDTKAADAAGRLNYATLNKLLEHTNELLKQGTNGEDATKLTRDKTCLEELLHAKAAVALRQAQARAQEGDLKQTRYLLEKIAGEDKQFAAENFEEFLNLTLMTNSDGNSKNIFEFHEHLIAAQQKLGTPSLPPEEISKELQLAKDCAYKLPQDEIQAIKGIQENNLKQLEEQLKQCSIEERPLLEALAKRSKQHLADLDSLEHAPAYVELLQGILELSAKNNSAALATFECIEEKDPQFAKMHQEQLDRLKGAAKSVVTDGTLRLCLEAAYTSTAILAGTLACLATSVSGPAALAVGAGAGMAARTALKAALEGDVSISDPVFGALDGLGSAAGLKVAEKTMNTLVGGAKASLAAERALAATRASSETIEALRAMQTGQRLLASLDVARDGLKAMRSHVSLSSRLASRLGYGGEAALAYRQAAKATRELGVILNRTSMLSAMAGGTTAGAIRQLRPLAYRLYNGDYENVGQLATQFAAGSFQNTLSCGFYGMLSPPGLNPLLAGDLYNASRSWIRTHAALDQNKLSRYTDELYGPDEARMRYLLLPGPRPSARTRR